MRAACNNLLVPLLQLFDREFYNAFTRVRFIPYTANIMGRFGKNSGKRQRTGTMIES